jgi:hypothetical protein
MIEKQTIDGRMAMVAYLTKEMMPATKEDWSLAKVIFDDNREVVWVTNVEADDETAGD